jgi:hypothetical protein
MGKILDKVTGFIDRHDREIVTAEFGLIGVLAGYLLSEPKVEEAVGNWMIDKAKKAVKNIHITYGDKPVMHVESGEAKSDRPMGYYDYLDRREARQHEEHMAEIKMRHQIYEGEGKVE